MKIISHKTHNPKIEIIEICGDITNSTVLEFKRYLYACLDYGRYNLIIDFKHVGVVDNEIINILSDFGIRDMRIRLFNVSYEAGWIIKKSGRSGILRKIYDVTDHVEAVSLFEREVLKLSRLEKGSINKRIHPRSLKVTLPAEFYYNPGENKIISGQLDILNISEKGALVAKIKVINKLTGRTFNPYRINGEKLYDLQFRLEENRQIIKTTVKCVRDFTVDEKLYAGLIFLDMDENIGGDIKEFVSSHYDLGRL
ncbi:MAG: STAS domain-containing protein [Candidatus Anammoxibacter sp.]